MGNIKMYERLVEDAKREILGNIREIMEEEKYHKFQEPVYVHYIEYEVATTEKCVLLEYSDSDGKFVFVTSHSSSPVEITTCDTEDRLMQYDFDSVLNLYKTLIAELRTEKIDEIKKIMLESGGDITISGNKCIQLNEGNGEVVRSRVKSVYYTCGYEIVKTEKSPKVRDKDTFLSNLDYNELVKLLSYIKEETEKTFNVTASNVLSRTFEVKAGSWEDAVKKVKAMLEKEPLGNDDGCGIQFS